MLRIPAIDICKVLGIGVADRVNTSTSFLYCFIFSLCFTPKRCSSSMTNNPKFLNITSLLNKRWVPMKLFSLT